MSSAMASDAAPSLKFNERIPPFAILAAGKLAAVDIQLNPVSGAAKDAAPILTLPSGDELAGIASILRFVARSTPAGSSLYGCDALAACQVDELLEFAATRMVNGAGLESACRAVDEYLATRTFLVGHTTTLADLAVWGQLQASPQWGKLRKSFPHLARWFNCFSAVSAAADVAEQYGMKPRAAPASAPSGTVASKKADAGGSFDIDLPGTEMGKVVTRFPPEPSGYLHIGHAKAALLNQEIADRFQGRLLVRFDDTNPSKEKDEYVDNIVEDIKRLGLRFETITYTSDYFPQLVDLAERLIKAGHIYADDTPVDKMREERMDGIISARRDRSVEENLRVWAEMQAGSEEGQANCLRIKLDMTAANKALRDPVCFRCNPTHHWRTGHTYKCYPTYDFACPFVDAIEGVTHALRTSEYKDREAQFYWILKLQQSVWPGLPWVHMWDYARLSFIYTVLSKRKLTWFVANGLVEGWNDPRMPTVQGMLRRGLQLPALREFILSQGASKNVTYQEWDKIWTINKRIIDPVCPRHTSVVVEGRVPFRLAGAPEPAEEVEVPRHLKNPAVGTKKQLRSTSLWLDQADAALLSDGEEVTLMAWGNAFVDKVHRDTPDGPVTAIDGRLHLEGDFKKTKLKLTWLADSPNLPTLELNHFGYLITKRKLEEEDKFEDYVNKESRSVTMAVGDANLRESPQGEVLQLERRGYYIVDVPFDPAHPEKPIVLFNIPDGRTKNMPGSA